MRSRSSSSASVHSTASATEEPPLSIFVKLLTGETIPLSLPQSTTIPTLIQLLSLRTSRPASTLRLTHAGRHLAALQPLPPTTLAAVSSSASSSTPTPVPQREPSTLASLNLQPHSTLAVALPLRGGMPPKKQRCTFKECREGAQRIVGDCGFCQGHFCGKHRMLEDHKCVGLEDCKAQSREQNKVKLESERTIVVKGI